MFLTIVIIIGNIDHRRRNVNIHFHHIFAIVSGIVVTGGAARVPELVKAFSRQTGGDLNVRVSKGLPENINISFGLQVGEPDRLYTLYGLLLSGKENCVGEISEAPVQATINFENTQVESEPESADNQVTPETQEEPKPKKPSSIRRIWKKIEDMLSDEAESDGNA